VYIRAFHISEAGTLTTFRLFGQDALTYVSHKANRYIENDTNSHIPEQKKYKEREHLK